MVGHSSICGTIGSTLQLVGSSPTYVSLKHWDQALGEHSKDELSSTENGG